MSMNKYISGIINCLDTVPSLKKKLVQIFKVVDSKLITTSADINTYEFTRDTSRLNGVRKCGNVVTVDLNLNGVVSAASGTVLATIPEGYRPVNAMYVSRDAATATVVDIKTNGDITTTSEFTSRAIRIHVGWIID